MTEMPLGSSECGSRESSLWHCSATSWSLSYRRCSSDGEKAESVESFDGANLADGLGIRRWSSLGKVSGCPISLRRAD